VGGQDSGHVVRLPELVKCIIPADREMCEVPHLYEGLVRGRREMERNITNVGIIDDRNYDPLEHHKTREYVRMCPPRGHQRTLSPRNLSPIERKKPHPQPIGYPEEMVDRHVLRPYPAYPGEHRQSSEYETHEGQGVSRPFLPDEVDSYTWEEMEYK